MGTNQLALIALNQISQLGTITIHRLLEKFKPAAIFEQSPTTLQQIPYLTNRVIKTILQVDWKKSATHELELAQHHETKIICYDDPDFPNNLRTMDYPPPVIYVKGELIKQDNLALAVVGTRRPTNYGKQVTKSLVENLVKQGLTIISGLAYGIDGLAHQTALEQQGRTIAVVAHGLDRVYPKAHQYLFQKIIGQGAIVSEFPFHYPALAHNFPRRNRIISGLAQGVVVVEAQERSGALITARWAGELGREVFAVPGSYFSNQSLGCHHLINDGAKLVSSIEDILEELIVPDKKDLEVEYKQAYLLDGINLEQQAIVKILMEADKHIDQLSATLKQPSHQLFSNLLTLEMKDVIIAQPGQVYQLNLACQDTIKKGS